MKQSGLFDFLKDELYGLMLLMCREIRTEADNEEIRRRFLAADSSELYRICHEHELDGVAGACAISLGLELPKEWMQPYACQKERQQYLMDKAVEVCGAMEENGIPMVVLKNGGIMIDMVHDAVKCPMEDVDTLVKKEDFHKAHRILLENGFNFKFRSEYEFEVLDEAFRDGSTEYYLDMPNGERIWFELAWRAVAGRWIRPDMEPDTNLFIDNSHLAGNTKVHVLAPEDNLLQVCIHTAKHSYVRAPGLRLHMDVDRIVAHTEIDWEAFTRKVKNTHVCTSTYLSLYIPAILFGTKVPEWVLEELKPRKAALLLRLLAKAGLPHPKERKFNKLQFLRFQTALYDSRKDMWHTLYPGKNWIEERYNCKGFFSVLKFTIIRGFDLVGIRKRK